MFLRASSSTEAAICRRCLLALLATLLLVGSAGPGTAGSPRRWFVQVWFESGAPIEADAGSDPGRIEVTAGGEFVGCAKAMTHDARWGEVILIPPSVGFIATGRREEIKVAAYGELGRLARSVVKITEVGGVEVAQRGR